VQGIALGLLLNTPHCKSITF